MSVDDKITCKKCGTSYEVKLLKNKNSLDKCLVCHEYFEDTVTCPSCGTEFKRELTEKQEDKNICCVCGIRFDKKTDAVIEAEILKSADKNISIHEIEEMYIENKDDYYVNLLCKHCGDETIIAPFWSDKIEKMTEKYAIFKPDVEIRCENCGYKSKQIVKVKLQSLDEIVGTNKYTYVPKCPHCNSISIEKISKASQVGKALALGVFAIPSMGKHWKCNVCGNKW